MGISRDCLKFFKYPLLSQERGKLLISNLASTFRGFIRIKAYEKFWRKGSVGVSRDCPFFQVPPIIHPNKSPLEILEKRERGRIQGLPNFFRVPDIMSGTGKATDFKFSQYIHMVLSLIHI